MYATPGNIQNFNVTDDAFRFAAVDKNYLLIGSHIDVQTQQKIYNHEYIDFAKILPCSKVMRYDDHCMELVSKGNYTTLCP